MSNSTGISTVDSVTYKADTEAVVGRTWCYMLNVSTKSLEAIEHDG